MRIDTETWKEFSLYNLFDITAGIYHYPDEYEEGNVPYISASNTDNGIQQRINLKPDFSGNCIITGKVGCTAFYQYEDFCATSDVNILRAKGFSLNQKIGIFITSIINFSENYKWSYGRQCRVGDSKYISIKLPIQYDNFGNERIDSEKTFSEYGYIPDFDFMLRYTESLHHKPLTTEIKGYKASKLNIDNWKEFTLGKYFDIKKGIRLTSDDQTEGLIPYIGAIDSNNGVANYIGQKAIHDGNTISLSYNGSVGEAFYQQNPFWATDDVNVLYFKTQNGVSFNKYIALFICSILKKEKYRYSYGRKWVLDNMIKTVIKLPEKNNSPDWKYMENYMKSLPYSDRV